MISCNEACGPKLELFANSGISWQWKWRLLCYEGPPSLAKPCLVNTYALLKLALLIFNGNNAKQTDGNESSHAKERVCSSNPNIRDKFPSRNANVADSAEGFEINLGLKERVILLNPRKPTLNYQFVVVFKK